MKYHFCLYIPLRSDKTSVWREVYRVLKPFISHYVQIKHTSGGSAPTTLTNFISHYVQIKLWANCKKAGEELQLYIPLRSDKTSHSLEFYQQADNFISHYVQIKLYPQLS